MIQITFDNNFHLKIIINVAFYSSTFCMKCAQVRMSSHSDQQAAVNTGSTVIRQLHFLVTPKHIQHYACIWKQMHECIQF